MQNSLNKHTHVEFLCPDCGSINSVGRPIIDEKYREHLITCQQCSHSLEIVVADGIHNAINIVASSVESEEEDPVVL